MEPLLKGIISGITISFLIGPIFLALVELTISKGWKSGIAYVFGVLIADVIMIYAVETVLQKFPFESIKNHIGFFGGIVLMLFGLITFYAKSNIQSENIANIQTLSQSFLKGFTINISNPFVTIWWITMYSTVTINYIAFSDKFLFYFGVLFMVFLFDLIKIRFAYYLKQNLTLDKLTIVKKTAGVLLFVFGISMLVKILCFS